MSIKAVIEILCKLQSFTHSHDFSSLLLSTLLSIFQVDTQLFISYGGCLRILISTLDLVETDFQNYNLLLLRMILVHCC